MLYNRNRDFLEAFIMENGEPMEKLLTNTDDPYEWERLYRRDKRAFSEIIRKRKKEGDSSQRVAVWVARIDYRPSRETFLLLLSILFGVGCWIPIRFILSIDGNFSDRLLLRSIPSVFFFGFGTMLLLLEKKKIEIGVLGIISIGLFAYYHTFAFAPESQEVILSVLHGYVFQWLLVGFLLGSFNKKTTESMSRYLALIGEIVCWSALILMAGMILSGISIALFNSLNRDIVAPFAKNIASLGIIIAPFLSVYLVKAVGDFSLSTIIARIIAPVALLAIVIFAGFTFATGSFPHENRDVFILYNLVMVLVLAILFFVNIEADRIPVMPWFNAILAVATLAFDSVILSAAFYRTNRYGLTPNRLVVICLNVLMFCHVAVLLAVNVRAIIGKRNGNPTIEAIIRYLPVYFVWSFFAILVLPIIF